MTVTLEALQEARYRSDGATGGIRGKKAAGDGSRGQSARKRGLGAAARPAEGPQAQPRGRPRRKKRRRDRAWLVRKGCGRKCAATAVRRHGRRPGGGAGGAAPAPAVRKKASSRQGTGFSSKKPDKAQVIIAKNKPHTAYTTCFCFSVSLILFNNYPSCFFRIPASARFFPLLP